MPSKIKRKYIESHWLIFALQGVVLMLSGLYIMFTPNETVSHLTIVIGTTLLVLAVIEIFNMIHRKRRQHNWGVALGVGLLELAVGLATLVGTNLNYEFHIAVLAAYTVLRSTASIVTGFSSFQNMTDRFIWVICGMIGCVLGFAILADPGISEVMFAKLFSTYMMVLGLSDLFFAIHSRDEIDTEKHDRAEKRQLAREAKKAKK